MLTTLEGMEPTTEWTICIPDHFCSPYSSTSQRKLAVKLSYVSLAWHASKKIDKFINPYDPADVTVLSWKNLG